MAGIVDIIRGVTSGLAAPVVDYLKARQELRSRERIRKEELKDALHTRKMELAKLGLTADMQWEQTFAEQAASSWKDEYTLMVVSIPAILAFVRTSFLDGPAIVSSGFVALSETPLWYQGMLISLFLATVGIRYWRRNQSDT
jgi:hypothetical protein